MALQDFTFGGSIAEPVLAPEESLILTTQGQILRNDEAVEATFHLSNRRVMASPHYGGDPIELALYAEVESAKLERRSIITGVVTMGNSRILVPQSHGDAFVAAFRAYQNAADTDYPSLRLTKRRDLDAAMSMILSEKRSGSSQEIYLGEMLGRLDLATVNADSLGQAMSRADWLPANYRVATRSAKLMALIGYYTREREIKASRLPESGIMPTYQSFSLAAAAALSKEGLQAVKRTTNENVDKRHAAYAAAFGYAICSWGGMTKPQRG
jgi:hypothetical protein